jgi:hypothetical protein
MLSMGPKINSYICAESPPAYRFINLIFPIGHVALGVVHYQLLRKRREPAKIALANLYKGITFLSWILAAGNRHLWSFFSFLQMHR